MESQFFTKVYQQLETDLRIIRQNSPRPADWAQKSLPVVRESLSSLKEHLAANPFKRRSEEIFFFREMKPKILCQLIYFAEVFNKVTRQSAKGEYTGQKEYWESVQSMIEDYFVEEEGFYKYLKQNNTSVDHQIFVRYPKNRFYYHGVIALEQDPIYFYGDPDFCTSHDYRVAKLLAYEALREFVLSQMQELEVSSVLPSPNIKFTGSPDDLVEFVRLLEGKLGNPKTGKLATREEIADYLVNKMNADLGEFTDYKTLELCSNGSDFGERIESKMEQKRDEWEKEEQDVEYDENGREKTEES